MTHILILAAGKGTRMGGDFPKVLRMASGKELVRHVLDRTAAVCPNPTIVVGYKGDEVRAALGGRYRYVEQVGQRGTGHAVLAAREVLIGESMTSLVVLYGDHPLITAEMVRGLVTMREASGAAVAMGTIALPDFVGDHATFIHFSRVIRGKGGTILRTVEFKDATDEEKKITEVNPAYYCFDPVWLWANISRLKDENAAGEYYLPDMVKIALADGRTVVSAPVDPYEGMGANTPQELEIVERYVG